MGSRRRWKPWCFPIYNKDLIDKPLDSLQAWLDYSKTQREQNKYGLPRQV